MALNRTVLHASWRAWLSNDLAPAGPAWLAWVWTLLFCTGLAAVFTVIGFIGWGSRSRGLGSLDVWAFWFSRNLIVCLTIGVIIHLMFTLTRPWVARGRLRRWQPWQRTAYFSGLPLLGTVVGWPLGVWLAGGERLFRFDLPGSSNIVLASVALSLLMTFFLHHFFAAKSQEIEAEKRATEAQLRLLQAQMEPHFLFNTLANVQSLIDHDPSRARRMLESFTDYLRATLTQLRSDDSTVGAELALAEAYLQLLQMRMEDRLAFRIEAEGDARSLPMPPLTLQPLVENAIHHGLEPKVEGGTVTLRARRDGDTLCLEVQDDGLGLDAAPRRAHAQGPRSNGMALANLRQRLQTRFGDDGRLELLPAEPGTLARITLPIA